MRPACASLLLVSLTALLLASDDPAPPMKVEAGGLHNVFRITDTLYSGNGPAGDKSFESLRKLGVKTIISVDAAQPDVERARKNGMRYVHIPVGYGGVPEAQALQIAKAVRELPGPFYVHCHHGKHRGPTSAAIARLCLDERCSTEAALDVLRQAGTDPRYKGLFRSVEEFRRPSAEDLAGLPKDLPEAVRPAGLVAAMVAIDQHWDNLKKAREAGWKQPPDHPDVDPPHEARQLVEAYEALLKQPPVARKPVDFRQWLTDGHAGARGLEEALRQGKEEAVDAAAAEKAYRTAGAACTQCHAKYRDVP
jgi:protein tyrosine phosphatase (PTP) superfamily phosphohydrolase (DUF442 family)